MYPAYKMSYLDWISNEDFEGQVQNLISSFQKGEVRAKKDLGRNIIDPFLTLFNCGLFGGNIQQWEERELLRQKEKTLSNAMGLFHQGIISKVRGWSSPSRKVATFDLLNENSKIIAEIKNKHNTIKASDKVKYYDKIQKQLDNKTSLYNGYTAYFVQIVPKHIGIFPFTTSDNDTGTKRPEHPLIKEIDGKSFYALATGSDSALEDLINALPVVFQAVTKSKISDNTMEHVRMFFAKAYTPGHKI